MAIISSLLVDGLIILVRTIFSVDLATATQKPAQHCNLMSGLQSSSASILKSISCSPRHPILNSIFCPPHHPETLQAATNTGSGLKGNRLMHRLCKFHIYACYLWQARGVRHLHKSVRDLKLFRELKPDLKLDL